MKRTRATKLVAALFVVSMLAAACGDDSGSSAATTAAPATTAGGATTTAAGGSTTAPAAGTCKDGAATLKVGGLVQAANFAGMEDGIKASIAKINKTCVGGRKLEFVGIKDDGSDPQKNLDAAKALVEQDKVFAIIATSAVLLPQTTSYLADKKVPFFGWGFMPGFCAKDSWGYGFNGCLSAYALNASKALDLPGAKLNTSLSDPIAKLLNKAADKFTLVIFNSDDDSGKFGDIQYAALFNAAQVVGKANVPVQGVGDSTQFVNLVNSKKPDAVMVSTDFVTAVKLKAAIVQSGYKGVVYDYVTYVPGLLDASKDTAAALEGGYSVSQFPQNEDSSTAAAKQILADLVASGSKLPFATQGASIGYWSTELLGQMLTATASKGDITADNFRKVAESGFKSTPVAGGLGVVTYPDNHFNPVPCAGVVQVKDGKYVSVVPFACYTLK
jgi:branched-chain amino acid transport system substrate-binding protein